MHSAISDYVRQYDRDHFICSLFVSKSFRNSYLALYGLNIEINNIIYDCSESMIALIRLAWWRERMIDGNTNNEMISELINTIHSSNVPKTLINSYFEGYELMISQTPYKNVCDLEKIAEHTTVNLIKMLFSTAVKDYYNDKLAYHCGLAWHLMNSLRNTIHQQQNKVSTIERAKYHINQVEKMVKKVPKEIARITLQTKLAKLHLKHIQNSDSCREISPTMQIRMLLYSILI
ncbi:MAG: squalene/phytoene synthase family protein [Wolbachia endosymbiont of Fragariocoptes setiger]|nr:squalene/phytoene synthase family protein [Wolbachia endosymbiont of Fragariocoptes setiger]